MRARQPEAHDERREDGTLDLPPLFLNERRSTLSRNAVYYLVRRAGEPQKCQISTLPLAALAACALLLPINGSAQDPAPAPTNELAPGITIGEPAVFRNLALYPEGGCKGRRLHDEFKSGAFEVSMRTGVPIVPVFLHYEAQDDFEWQDPYTLPDKIRHMMSTVNNRANYHVFDPLDPKDFADKYAMKAEAYRRFSAWNDRFLE